MPSTEPEGDISITPSLVVSPCADAIEFYEVAFDAEEIEPRMVGPDGLIGHAEVRIAGSVVMLGDDWPDGPNQSPAELGGTSASLFINHPEADRLWQQALDAGAEVVFPFEMQFYGDEAGRIRDPFGHTWGIGRHVEDVGPEEMERRMAGFYENLPD